MAIIKKGIRVGPELFSLMSGGPWKRDSLIAMALYHFSPLSTLSGQHSHGSLSPACHGAQPESNFGEGGSSPLHSRM